MQAGAITQYIDVAQAAWWAFFLFFIGLVFYLRREDKREGYPTYDPTQRPHREVDDAAPTRTYIRFDGTLTDAPHYDPDPPLRARPAHSFPGAPLAPVGNPLTSALGPSTYTMRRDEPFRSNEGRPQVQPMRIASDWSVMKGDTDPRGMRVLDVRFRPVATVRDLWVDQGTKSLRYLEIELDPAEQGADTTPGPLLMPIYFCDIDEREREIRVLALRRGQFVTVPRPKSPDQITAREEDQVNAYYAGGRFHLDDTIEGVQS